MSRLLLTVMLLSASIKVNAQQQGGCPGGLVPAPTGACVSQAEANQMQAASAGAATPRYTGPLWQDRFGAIAVDGATGSVGWSSAATSKRNAQKSAIEDCGGEGCKIRIEARNTCLAVAWGGGISGFGRDVDLHVVESTALDSCKKGGGSNCKLVYSACSLPVRIR